MHQRQPCQKMSPLWTGLITRVTTLAQAKCSWSHRWLFAFSSWVYSISDAGMRQSWVWLDQLCSCILQTQGLCRDWREDKAPAETMPSFFAWQWGGLPRMTSSLPAQGGQKEATIFELHSVFGDTHTAFACRFVFSGVHECHGLVFFLSLGWNILPVPSSHPCCY